MRDAAWNEGFDIHLVAVDDGAAGEFRAFDVDPEVAPLGEIEGRGGVRGGVRGSGLRHGVGSQGSG